MKHHQKKVFTFFFSNKKVLSNVNAQGNISDQYVIEKLTAFLIMQPFQI